VCVIVTEIVTEGERESKREREGGREREREQKSISENLSLLINCGISFSVENVPVFLIDFVLFLSFIPPCFCFQLFAIFSSPVQ